MSTIYTIDVFETNKNAVLFQYPHLSSYGPSYPGERPSGCVVLYHGYYIRFSKFLKYFEVYKASEKVYKSFPTLKEAKRYAISLYNKKHSFF